MAGTDPPDSLRRLDLAGLAREGAVRTGQVGVHQLLRLSGGLADGGTGTAVWEARFSTRRRAGASAQVILELTAEADVRLVCQRCLEVLERRLAVRRTFCFVREEAEVERLDEQSEDEDVLALPRRLDLQELLEDELILALPIVPMHEECPKPPVLRPVCELPGQEDRPRPNPFAALAALRPAKADD